MQREGSTQPDEAPGWPADRALTHPIVVAATALWVLNDHVWKGAGVLPGWLTGKLSDLTGLFVFPMLLTALIALLCGMWGARPARRTHRRHARAAVLATGAVFSAAQVWPAFNAWLAGWWGVLTMDPTDLLTLPALLLSYRWMTRDARQPHAASPHRRTLRPAEALALLTVSLASIATPAKPPPRYFITRAYPVWRVATLEPHRRGCVAQRVWVAKSGKTGVGVVVHLRNTCDHAVRASDVRASLAIETSGGPHTVRAPERVATLVVEPRGEGYVYLPIPFDNNAAWNRGERRGVLSIHTALERHDTNTPLPGSPIARIGVAQRRSGPKRKVSTGYYDGRGRRNGRSPMPHRDRAEYTP